MDDPKPRPFLDFLTCLALVLLLSFAGLVGYYSAACSDRSGAVGMAMMVMLFGAFAAPATAIVAASGGVVVAFIGSVFLRPAESMARFGATCLAGGALALGSLIVIAKIADAADAYARCSIGF
ncbi:hypothetical protein [Novilysobacter antarcticus]|uniref:hypothetical protein n=1 Tax=Novilysobacter antarcticus TaxID=2862543 RepID=UPI001C98F651|nr:hypothetical protein [Lysobacter antarcticus]